MTTLILQTLLYPLLSHVQARDPPHPVGAYFLPNSLCSIDRKYTCSVFRGIFSISKATPGHSASCEQVNVYFPKKLDER